MDFLTMQQELSDRLGAFDQTISSDATKLKRWLNIALQDICGMANWPFMLYSEIIQTVVDITTGTAAVVVGGTTVTLTNAPTVSCAERFIRFDGDSNWYKITAHTASATTMTITPAYYGTADLTAQAFKIRKLFYATNTPLDSVYSIKMMTPGRMLESANSRDVDMFLPLYWDSGSVYKYFTTTPDSSGGARFSFIYSPSDVQNLQVTGVKNLVAMSADSDTPIIPARWHSAVVNLAAFYGFLPLDDSRAKVCFDLAEKGIEDMKSVYDQDLGRSRLTRSLVTGVLEGPAYTLPPQYGVNQG